MNNNSTLQTSIQHFSTFLFAFLIACGASGQILPGNLDDFQNGTTQGWSEGAPSPNPPTVVPNGGPAGDSDAFVRNFSAGGSGAGSKWIMFNTNSKWTGDYLSSGVSDISFDVRNLGPANIHIRIAFHGAGGPVASTSSFTFTPDSMWHHISFEIEPASFVAVPGTGNVEQTLGSVSEFRILSSVIPSDQGDAIPVFVDVDNVLAEPTTQVYDVAQTQWKYHWDHEERTLTFPDAAELTRTDFRLFNNAGQLMMQENIIPTDGVTIPECPPGIYFAVIDRKELFRLILL
jgi:hypothetical protein